MTMNTTEPQPESYRLTHQQQRFCDLYLTHFNAFKAAVECGYSANTSRKGALLHVPKIQRYLKEAMNRRSQRLEITHDMILRELSKIAFSNMGNYYDEYACLKRMSELTVDEKAAISYYDFVEIQDADGYRVGTQSRIKLHNKMSALDKIARHLGFYGTLGKEGKGESEKVKGEGDGQKLKGESEKEEGMQDGLLVRTLTEEVVVDRSSNNLPMDYPVEDFELEGIELKTLIALEGVDVSPGSLFSPESEVESLELEAAGGSPKSFPLHASTFQPETENMENILTISPLLKDQKSKVKIQNDLPGGDGVREFALGIGADTGPSTGSGQAVAKACVV
jgi:hypothetical protein